MSDVIQIIHAQLFHHRGEITSDSTLLGDLRCDPLDILCITQALEEEYGDLPSGEIELCDTVGDIEALVEREAVPTCAS